MEQWREIQETVQKSIKTTEYSCWIAPLSFDKIDLDTLYINAPTRLIADWVKRNFSSHILNAAKPIIPNINNIKFITKSLTNKKIDTDNSLEPEIKETRQPAILPKFLDSDSFLADNNYYENISLKLKPEYTFDSFITDPSNSFVYESLKQITTNNSIIFNPLVIHSPSGLGKTHLLNALANEIQKNNPEKNIIYISASKFMDSFVKALKENKIYQFKQKIKSADILLIDDIHSVVGKEGTSKELFHIIDDFIAMEKQIVITSNTSPYLIEGLNENIKSRIAAGLTLDIKPSNYDLRLKVIEANSEKLNIKLDTGVKEFIASKITSSIMELKGAINKLAFHSTLCGTLSLHYVRGLLSDILAANTKEIDINKIKQIVAEKWNVSVKDIDSKKRTNSLTIPRQVAMYIAKTITNKTLPEIGKIFYKNHATVIHAVKKIKDLMITNPHFENIIHETEHLCSNI